ncbi:MAG: hypothetical protein JW912_01110 [Sedimentisphaerales bacterium]|nr:hypothetical protein [Sedimentisphaerales bacterium]
MKKVLLLTILMFLLSGQWVLPVLGDALTIFDIQYSTDPDGSSPKNGEVIDCVGGVVVHKRIESKPRLILYDPIIRDVNVQGDAGCWSAIQVKDWFYYGSFNDVAVGDWVEFYNVTVEEFRGTTFLQYWLDNPDDSVPGFTIVSSNNSVPDPVKVNLNEITSPVEDVGGPGDWYVNDHWAEKYESMRLEIKDVVITDMDNGKADDNYTLQSAAELNDPNFSCWAADYMNVDKIGDYHPYVEIGQHFCTVRGIFEQYTNLVEGWDYYQLLTTDTGDFLTTQPADLDGDCDVDLLDYGHFSQYWLAECYSDPNLCGGADIMTDDVVNTDDLGEFVYYWLDGTN